MTCTYFQTRVSMPVWPLLERKHRKATMWTNYATLRYTLIRCASDRPGRRYAPPTLLSDAMTLVVREETDSGRRHSPQLIDQLVDNCEMEI